MKTLEIDSYYIIVDTEWKLFTAWFKGKVWDRIIWDYIVVPNKYEAINYINTHWWDDEDIEFKERVLNKDDMMITLVERDLKWFNDLERGILD